MTPIEVEANRRRAEALMRSASQIITKIKDAGYSFAETPEESIGYAIEELMEEPLRDIDARFDELERQAREDARVECAILNARGI